MRRLQLTLLFLLEVRPVAVRTLAATAAVIVTYEEGLYPATAMGALPLVWRGHRIGHGWPPKHQRGYPSTRG
jgi:hypothetical protein